MPGFLSPRKGMPLLLIPEYSGINKGQRIPDRSKTAHRKPFVQCFLTAEDSWSSNTCLFEVSSSSDSFARIVPVGSTGDFNPGVTHLQLEIIKLSGPGWCRARHHSTVHQSSTGVRRLQWGAEIPHSFDIKKERNVGMRG